MREQSSSPIEIHSPDSGVSLRQFTPADAREVFALIDRNRPHLSQHGDVTAGKYLDEQAVIESIQNPPNPQKLRFGIRNGDGVLVGSVNLKPEEANLSIGEIGYYLGSEFTGQGYMTQAVRALTEFAFDDLGFETLYGEVHQSNTASARVLERTGYTRSGQDGETIRFSRSTRARLG